MKEENENNIEDILLKAGLITYEKLKKFREQKAKTGEKIENILLSESTFNYREVLGMVAGKMGVEFVDLETIKVNREAIGYITPDIAKKYKVFPFDTRDNLLFLAMQKPDEIFLIDEIKVYTQMEIKPFLADYRLIDRAIGCFYTGRPGAESNETGIDDSKVNEVGAPAGDTQEEAAEVLGNDTETAIKNMILKALELNATDIHLDKMNNSLRIRYRIDGRLVGESGTVPVSPEDMFVNIKVMGGLLTGDKSMPVKGRMRYDISRKESINTDVHVLPTVNGDKLLLRIDRRRLTYALEELGMSDKERNTTEAMLGKKRGIIVVTGPGGSGRTSTSYALLRKLLHKNLNIITVERNIIEKIQGVSQFQVPKKAEEGVLQILKSISEHDADVLMVDTGFDISVFKYLVNLSLGGRLVITTAGFQNTADTLSGLINSGVEPYLVATSVEGVISQCLARKLCPKCKGRSALQDLSDTICDECGGNGYRGKTGIFEVFNMNSEYRKAVLRDSSLETLESMLENEESTLRGNCIKLVNNETTSIEELIALGVVKELFKS